MIVGRLHSFILSYIVVGVILIGPGGMAYGGEYIVSSKYEFEEAVQEAQPGDEIIIANGHYENWGVQINCRGTAAAPITIHPESEGGAVFTGTTAFRLTGQYVILKGLSFEGCTTTPITLQDASFCRVTGCRFVASRATVINFRGQSDDNRIDHCTFLHTEAKCIVVTINTSRPPLRNRLDHNLFQDVPRLGRNGRSTIQIGQFQTKRGLVESLTLVDYNVFLRCNGDAEIISNKSSRNTYRYNLFKDCQGELVMRGGSHCVIEGNRFEGCNAGIRLSGTYHTVENNVIIDSKSTGIRLFYGMTRKHGSLYVAPGHCLIANNTIVNAANAGIFIGEHRNRDARTPGKKWNTRRYGPVTLHAVAPYKNRFINNIITGSTGELLKVDHSPDNVIANNLFYNTGNATLPLVNTKTLVVNPLFMDSGNGDYQLSRNSPAIGRGIPLAPGVPSRNIGASAEPLRAGPSVKEE